MTTTIKSLLFATGVLSLAPAAPGPALDPRLSATFDLVALSPEQRAAVDAGRPVAKVLAWGGASEVHVFGAIHIDGSPETYLKLSRDVSRLAGTPGYLAIGDLPGTAQTADLSGLSLDPDDIKALKTCREGNCDVQLPTN